MAVTAGQNHSLGSIRALGKSTFSLSNNLDNFNHRALSSTCGMAYWEELFPWDGVRKEPPPIEPVPFAPGAGHYGRRPLNIEPGCCPPAGEPDIFCLEKDALLRVLEGLEMSPPHFPAARSSKPSITSAKEGWG